MVFFSNKEINSLRKELKWVIKGELRPNLTRFYHIFNDCMEKVPCTKVCVVLISSQRLIKSQNFNLKHVIPANVQKISALVLFAHFC